MAKTKDTEVTFLMSEVPGNFTRCLKSECPLAERCLHQVVMRRTPAKEAVIRVYHPDAVTGGEDCRYFKEMKLTRFAKGFTMMQEEMLPRQYAEFKFFLMSHWGRNPFYERRSGKLLLPPSAQELVMEALRRAGVRTDMEFDGYEYRINWHS